MQVQKLYSLMRQAVDHYHMISEGDHIAVGLSGGKDSLTLLYGLAGLRRFYPEHFELTAITVDLGFEGFDTKPMSDLCEHLGVPLKIVHTQIGPIIFDHRKEKHPCSLCATMRKGALADEAQRLGCNKIAYGHHKDDMVETMLMSLIYMGRFYAYPPVTDLEGRSGKLTVIRPLMYTRESEVIGFVNKYGLIASKNPCPADGHTKREYAKSLMHQINKDNPGAVERMFSAIENGHIFDWPIL